MLEIAQDLYEILSNSPGLNKYQLRDMLGRRGWSGISTKDINSVLYSYTSHFRRSDDSLPRWDIIPSDAPPGPSAPPLPPPDLRYYKGPTPREWQTEAFEAWRQAGHRGVIEAVTGTGKTTVGIMAAADAVARGRRVLVIVPGLDLLNQWYEKMNRELPDLAIGRYGDIWKDTLYDHRIIVSTVQSAYRRRILPDDQPGLLIADEVHHYGAEQYALALKEEYDERLGLTATYERADEGIANILTPYFWPKVHQLGTASEIVARCDYARGLADGILAQFKVALIGTDLSSDVREKYEQYSGQISKHRSRLVHDFDCPAEPFGEFMRAVNKLKDGNNPYPEMTRSAIIFLYAFGKHRALLAETTAKLDALKLLSPVLSTSEGALVFTETVDGANLSAAILAKHGVAARAYTSRMNRDQRREVLTLFRNGDIKVLCAPRVLDEGIDLPEADIGIIVSASHSRRQMIQRMGRIIRPKRDQRPAIFIILYVRDTSEDPELGAHETFLSEMQDNALDCDYLDLYRNPKALDIFIAK